MDCSTPMSFVLCYLPGVYSNSCPLSPWCHSTISSSVTPFFPCLQSFPGSWSFPTNWLFAGANLQHQSLQWIFRVDFLSDWLVWSPCCLRDSWESSPEPQFKSINSWMLSLLYDLTLTSVYDYWKNHSSDNGTWLWIGFLLTEMLEGQDTGRKSHGTTGFSFPILSPFHKWSSLLWFIIKRIVF